MCKTIIPILQKILSKHKLKYKSIADRHNTRYDAGGLDEATD